MGISCIGLDECRRRRKVEVLMSDCISGVIWRHWGDAGKDG